MAGERWFRDSMKNPLTHRWTSGLKPSGMDLLREEKQGNSRSDETNAGSKKRRFWAVDCVKPLVDQRSSRQATRGLVSPSA